jgi:hypothetical protein
MHKHTKKNKRSKRKNKTVKYYGGTTSNIYVNNNKSNLVNVNDSIDSMNEYSVNNQDKNETIAGIVGNELTNYVGPTANYLKDKGLRLLQLQPINKDDINKTTANVDAKINEISDTTSSLISNAKNIGMNAMNIFDKGTGAIIANINDVLKNPKVNQGIVDAAKETATIGVGLLKNFNENVSTPEFKEQTKQTMKNVAEISDIVIKKMDKPINEAIDKLSESGNKIASAAAVGAVNAATDAAAVVPGLGAVIEIPKLATDLTNSASKITGAVSEASNTFKKVFDETIKHINEGIIELKRRQKEGLQIANRTNKSINNFQMPLKGGYKTRRNFYKHKR